MGAQIIVGALGLILGDRANTEVVRQGAHEAEVEALFELQSHSGVQVRLDEMGLAIELKYFRHYQVPQCRQKKPRPFLLYFSFPALDHNPYGPNNKSEDSR